MDGTSGFFSDKTRVLDIKPLRSLLPVFPNDNQAPPFVCAPPFGPFPSGFSPFYPFSSAQGNQNQPTPVLNQSQIPQQNQPQPSFVTPLRPFTTPGAATASTRSFRTPEMANASTTPGAANASTRSFRTPEMANGSTRSLRTPEMDNGNVELQEGSSSSLRRKQKKPPRSRKQSLQVDDNVSGNNFESGISVAERDNGNRELVISVLMRFDALRRRFSQLDDTKESGTGIIRRPDLKTGSTCMSRGVRTNVKKRPGIVPGIEIGDIFFFRFEMCLVGLHSPSMAGIDYMIVKTGETDEEHLATSIVSSGYYDNDEANPDILIYTGQGGNADKDKQTSDQKLERGNLALNNSFARNSAVRVIRGFKESSQSVKIYMYDGLYEIKDSWQEQGKSGHITFKYKLVRIPDQPPAYSLWTAIQKWKTGMREGLVLRDLTYGNETIPVSLVNDIDAEKGPESFTYSSKVTFSESFRAIQPSSVCNCVNICKPGNLNCLCIQKNGGDFPYIGNGVLVCRKPMIYECSSVCSCVSCKNKVTQTGIKLKLEVFKTVDKGWGLRSLDPIRAGSFICIYAGEAKDKSKVQQTVIDNDDYIFDTTRFYTPFKWNYEPGLADEDALGEIPEDYDIQVPIIISAKNVGNVARFMNHSCCPNVFWQPVTYEYNNHFFIHVAFFALTHIPPLTELTYDYGVSRQSGTQYYGRKRCFCRSEKCLGSFG